ncbi:MAG: hypothetical protein ACLSGK_02370 [Lachnospiraceae bacterium]
MSNECLVVQYPLSQMVPNSESQDQIETMAEAATEGEPVVTSLDTSSEEQQPIADTQTKKLYRNGRKHRRQRESGEAARRLRSNDQNVTTPSKKQLLPTNRLNVETLSSTRK